MQAQNEKCDKQVFEGAILCDASHAQRSSHTVYVSCILSLIHSKLDSSYTPVVPAMFSHLRLS